MNHTHTFLGFVLVYSVILLIRVMRAPAGEHHRIYDDPYGIGIFNFIFSLLTPVAFVIRGKEAKSRGIEVCKIIHYATGVVITLLILFFDAVSFEKGEQKREGMFIFLFLYSAVIIFDWSLTRLWSKKKSV